MAPATDVVDMHRQEIAVLTQELGSCRRQIDSLNRQLEFANVMAPNYLSPWTGTDSAFNAVIS